MQRHIELCLSSTNRASHVLADTHQDWGSSTTRTLVNCNAIQRKVLLPRNAFIQVVPFRLEALLLNRCNCRVCIIFSKIEYPGVYGLISNEINTDG